MLQTVIRDTGGSSPVRIISSTKIVDGSVLIVPTDTIAIVISNGHPSKPYKPGRYEIYTGVSPYFVHLKNIMTAGDAGITVQIVFINSVKEYALRNGTGRMYFKELRFDLTMNVYAAYKVRYIVTDPDAFLSSVVGLDATHISESEIEENLNSRVSPIIRENISNTVCEGTLYAAQNTLTDISCICTERMNADLAKYGISVRGISITEINISETDLQKLRDLEENYAEGKMKTDLEADNVSRVYGDIKTRTIVEMMTGTARGPAQFRNDYGGMAGSIAGTIASMPVQYEMTKKVLNSMSDTINDMFK